MEITRRTIVDAGYFADWKQYNLGGIAFRRYPEPIRFTATKISKTRNANQVDRNFIPTEPTDLCYQYVVDIYVAASLINGGLDDGGIFNPGNSSGTRDAIEQALLSSGFRYAPYPGTSLLGKGPMWSSYFISGQRGSGESVGSFVFEDLSGTLGEDLYESEKIEPGVAIGAFQNNKESVYNILINPSNNSRGYFVAEGSNDAVDLRNDWGVWVDIANGVMRIDIGMYNYLPLPYTWLDDTSSFKFMMPKLFMPYISFGNGIVVCTWIGVTKPDPAQAGINWNVSSSIAFGPTPSANYNHFFPCTLIQGVDDANGGIYICLEKITLFGQHGGFYNANGVLTQNGTVTVTGSETNATLTAADGTVWSGFDLSNFGTIATSPAAPSTKGTGWPRNDGGQDG